MTYRFQLLRSQDTGILRSLLRVFGEAFEQIEVYESPAPSEEYLRALLGKPHVVALAALDRQEVVGGLVAYVLEKFEQERSEMYLYDLAVSEPHRRRGVARGLIAELKQIAATLGVYVIFVQADPEDAPAIRLYESLGIREDVHHFDIPVDHA